MGGTVVALSGGGWPGAGVSGARWVERPTRGLPPALVERVRDREEGERRTVTAARRSRSAWCPSRCTWV